MAIHEKRRIIDKIDDDIYASSDLATSIPKYKIPQEERDPRHALAMVRDELMLDGNSRQNLATFCQTWFEPEARKLLDDCIDKNMIDKDEYPQTSEIEARCVHMLADLWNAPPSHNSVGCSTVGSSEGAMLGGMALKWKWRSRQKAMGKCCDRPNIVTGPVQVCWHKFARYWDVEIREIPMEKGRLIMNGDEVVARCDENTIGVVPTLGVTFTCQYEPVEEICNALDKLQADSGIDIPVHVDAASGGFVAPFSSPDLLWDFRLPRVKSINASGHKFGLSPLGVGWVLWREASELPEELIFRVNYLGGDMPTFALNFSRPGGQVIAQYYNFLRLGREGYRKIHDACYETARSIARGLERMGPFSIIYDGEGGIPAVSWSLKEGEEHGFTLFDLSDKIRSRGWQIAAYSMPPNQEELVVMRVLVRHGVSKELGDQLLKDIESSLLYLQRNPVTVPLLEREGGGFSH